MRRTKTMLMGEVLSEFFSQPYVAAKLAEARLPETWREVVGDSAADVTTSLRLENLVLHAHIAKSVIRHELFMRRDALVEEINRVAGMRLVNVVLIK